MHCQVTQQPFLPCQIVGLPNDALSVENGVITRFSLRWTHYIDPQGQANKWIKNLVRAVGRKARSAGIGETVFCQELCRATSGFGSRAAKPQAMPAQTNQHQTVSTSTFIPGGLPFSGKAVQGRRSPHVSKQGIRFPLWHSTNILGAFPSQNNTSMVFRFLGQRRIRVALPGC